MEQRPLPTAEELGITDAEYQLILRDLRRRHDVALPAPEPGSPAAGATRATPTRTPGRQLWPLAVLALPLVVWLGTHVDRDPDGPTYAFTDMVDDRPVTYSSCGLIRVAVYPAGGPPDAEELVTEAVERMRRATGLDLVVVGSFGGHAPNWNFEAAPIRLDDPVSVSWQDGDAIAEMTDDVAGLGGSVVVPTPYGGKRRVGGTIALSRDYYARLTERGDHDEALAVLLHEFGHVLGLAHVDSSRELMDGGNGERTTLGLGDLEGLRQLGRGPCV